MSDGLEKRTEPVVDAWSHEGEIAAPSPPIHALHGRHIPPVTGRGLI